MEGAPQDLPQHVKNLIERRKFLANQILTLNGRVADAARP